MSGCVGRAPSPAWLYARQERQVEVKSSGRGRPLHTVKNMAYKVTLIPGDGIGPEVTQATVRILRGDRE